MAGLSTTYPCHNIPSCLLVGTSDDFTTDRQLEKPLNLRYFYTREGNNLNGVLLSIYTLGKVLELIEKRILRSESKKIDWKKPETSRK